jgi:hypothetical protein
MSSRNTTSINLSREFAMARFSEPHLASAPHDAPNSSPLLIGNMGSAMDGSRTLAGMLLAAAMAALLVVADQLIETWTDGHLLVGWVALWTVVFAALALLTPPLRHVAAFVAGVCTQRLEAWREANVQERMWETARHDPRILEEIRAAVARQAT